ncbi:MAG: Metallophos protein, partial [Pseudomonadota bacterium]|nr:Metallophos protein [Pseudomonadota bacterium]
MRKHPLLLLLPLALLTACNGHSDNPTANRPITVTILHTNDTHSRLEPFPRDSELSASNTGPQQGGIARRKALIDQVRAAEPHVMLLDAGDNFQGTIFYNAWKGSAEVMALNTLSYDAVTLGNHEFDLGSAELGRALQGGPVTIADVAYPTEKLQRLMIATNVDASGEPALTGLFRPNVVLERGGEHFGILGIVTEDVPRASSPGPNLRFFDYIASVQAEVDRLTAQGINKIILLSHYGYQVDLEKAPQLSGVDLIISGHDHALLGDPAAIEAVAPGQGAQVKGPYPTVVTAKDGNPVLVV